MLPLRFLLPTFGFTVHWEHAGAITRRMRIHCVVMACHACVFLCLRPTIVRSMYRKIRYLIQLYVMWASSHLRSTLSRRRSLALLIIDAYLHITHTAVLHYRYRNKPCSAPHCVFHTSDACVVWLDTFPSLSKCMDKEYKRKPLSIGHKSGDPTLAFDWKGT